MKGYTCEKCEMSVKPLVCASCDCELVDKTIEKNGNKIHVSECPKCHGKVKGPSCCGVEMKAS